MEVRTNTSSKLPFSSLHIHKTTFFPSVNHFRGPSQSFPIKISFYASSANKFRFFSFVLLHFEGLWLCSTRFWLLQILSKLFQINLETLSSKQYIVIVTIQGLVSSITCCFASNTLRRNLIAVFLCGQNIYANWIIDWLARWGLSQRANLPSWFNN